MQMFFIESEKHMEQPLPFHQGRGGAVLHHYYFIAFPLLSFLDSEATFTSKSAVVLLSSTNFFPSHLLTNASPEEMG